jgi:hypothetical protein
MSLHHGSVTLKNSAPGTIPTNSVHEFSNRWTKSKILDDDERYYCEDGFTIDYIKDNVVFLKEIITPSLSLLSKAVDERSKNNLANAESLLTQAIDIFTGNTNAHSELIEILIMQDRIDDAIKSAVNMTSHISDPHPIQILLAQLYMRKKQPQNAKRLVDDLLTDWTVSEQIRDLANKINQILHNC